MKLETQKRIAENLKVLRVVKNFSQAEMAEMVGISRSLYTHYELGRRTPDAEILFHITNRFGVNMGILFDTEPRHFLAHLATAQYCEDELVELSDIYRSLSPLCKGMLLERGRALREWDKMRQDNLRALKKKRGDIEEESV